MGRLAEEESFPLIFAVHDQSQLDLLSSKVTLFLPFMLRSPLLLLLDYWLYIPLEGP